MGHLHLHNKPNLYECMKVHRSEIFKQNLDSLKFYCIFSDFRPPSSSGYRSG